jgi:hypothetical protein
MSVRPKTELFTMQKAAVDSRSSTQELAARIDTLDVQVAGHDDEGDLFDLVDKDKSGTISRDEFAKVVHVIKTNVSKAHRTESEAERAARRVKLMRLAVITLGLFLVFFLVGNMGLSYTVYRLSKDTQVGSSAAVVGDAGAEHVVMTDRYQHAVQTGAALSEVGQEELAHAADTDLPQRLKGARYLTPGGGAQYAAVKAWSLNGRNVSTHTLWDGAVIASDADAFALVQPPTSVVTPVGSSVLASLCLARGCEALACTGLRSSATHVTEQTAQSPDDADLEVDVLHTAACSGLTFWSWPQPLGVGASDDAHELTLNAAVNLFKLPALPSSSQVSRRRRRLQKWAAIRTSAPLTPCVCLCVCAGSWPEIARPGPDKRRENARREKMQSTSWHHKAERAIHHGVHEENAQGLLRERRRSRSRHNRVEDTTPSPSPPPPPHTPPFAPISCTSPKSTSESSRLGRR